MQNITGKFIGDKKIKETFVADRKTYLGKEVLAIIYEGNQTGELPAELAEKMATDEPTDATTLRDMQVNSVVEKMLAILLDSEIKIADVEYTLSKTSSSLQISLDKATEILWGKDLYERTLADINKVLIIKQDGTTKPTKPGRQGKKVKPSAK
jgi:hypothetical protein